MLPTCFPPTAPNFPTRRRHFCTSSARMSLLSCSEVKCYSHPIAAPLPPPPSSPFHAHDGFDIFSSRTTPGQVGPCLESPWTKSYVRPTSVWCQGLASLSPDTKPTEHGWGKHDAAAAADDDDDDDDSPSFLVLYVHRNRKAY